MARRPGVVNPAAMRWAWPLLLGLLLACGDDAVARPRPEPDRTPAAEPEGLAAAVSFGGGRAVMAELRSGVESAAVRTFLPESPAALYERFVPLPEAALDRIPDDAPVHVAVVREGEDHLRLAVATRVRTEASATHPLGVEVPMGPDGPHGSRWLFGAPRTGDLAVALIDDVVVAARDREVLARTIRYLAFTRMPAEVEPGLSVRVVDGVVASAVRPMLDRALREQLSTWRRAAAAERARHDTPPELGDPEAVIALVEQSASPKIALLPDVGEVRLRLQPVRGTIVLTVDAAVRPDSPLARELEGASTGAPLDLGALPVEVALGLSLPRSDDPVDPVAALAEVGGARLDARAARSVAAGWAALTRARGDRTLWALGAAADDSWALVGSAGQAPDAEALRAGVAAPYARDVVGALVGCEGPASPGRLTASPGAEHVRAGALCATADGPGWAIAAPPGAFAVTVSRSGGRAAGGVGDAVAARFVDPAAAGGLRADADVARALASLGDGTLLGGVLTPSRLLGALAVLGAPPLRRAAAASPPRGRSPIVFALVRTEAGVGLRAMATPAALDDAATTALAFVRPAGAGD